MGLIVFPDILFIPSLYDGFIIYKEPGKIRFHMARGTCLNPGDTVIVEMKSYAIGDLSGAVFAERNGILTEVESKSVTLSSFNENKWVVVQYTIQPEDECVYLKSSVVIDKNSMNKQSEDDYYFIIDVSEPGHHMYFNKLSQVLSIVVLCGIFIAVGSLFIRTRKKDKKKDI